METQEIIAARQPLVLRAQKAWAYFVAHNKLNQGIIEDALEQLEY